MSNKVKSPTIAPRVVKKSVFQTRLDIADWNNAKRLAQLADNPKFYLLQNLFDEIANDGLLTSQINNRHEITSAADFEFVNADNKVDDRLTAALQDIPITADIIKAILDSEMYGYNLVELSSDRFGNKKMDVIPRQNLDPVHGRFYPDIYQRNYVEYRDTAEFGKFLLEFYSGHLGLLNKTVPHVLFKKFAQSCWSELCEIYGIPPRYVKTNTTDPAMLDRAEKMLNEMGAAAAFVIDTTEEFEFAQGVSTNGDVYNNLIKLCNNENSLLIAGVVIGQDTEHGNYSKEQTALSILDRLIAADKRFVESYMNSIVIPAFVSINWLPATSSKFRFSAVEDTEKLWSMVKDLLAFKEVDNEWITEKFGIPVKDKFIDSNQLRLLDHVTLGDPNFFA